MRSSLLFLAIAISTVLGAPGRGAAEVEIKLGTFAPKGSPWDVLLREMAQKWSEASSGQVKLRIYPGGVLGNEGDVVRKMRNGTLAAAALTVVGLHEITPEPAALDAPFAIESYKELDYVMSKLTPRLDQAMEKKGYIVLAWSELGWVRFFSKLSFHTPAQAKEAKLFAWEGDPASVDAWKAGGFHPVVLSATDIVPSLQTGLIDTVAAPALWALAARMHQRAPNMLDLPWCILTGATVVKKDVWERIPAELRPRLLEIAKKLGRQLAETVRAQEDSAVTTMKAQGLKIEKPEDVAAWRSAADRANVVVREKVTSPEFFDAVIKYRNEYRAQPK